MDSLPRQVMNKEQDLVTLLQFLGASKQYARTHLTPLRRMLLLRRVKTDRRPDGSALVELPPKIEEEVKQSWTCMEDNLP
jgi:hypothetical protein